MNIIEVYKRVKFAFLVAFIFTVPALVTAGFKVFEVPSIAFFDEEWNWVLNGIAIFPVPFIAFLTQKLNVLLTYFPPSFLGGLWLGRFFVSQQTKTKILRGLKRVDLNEMKNTMKKIAIQKAKKYRYSPASRLNLAGIPIAYSTEAQNFLCLGGAGNGKTQSILSLTEQIKNFSETMIFLDRKPDFFPKYYREDKDYIFYPIDKRSLQFNLLEQIDSNTVDKDVSFIANAIIPDENGTSDHWNQSARNALKAILFTLYFITDKSNRAMVQFLQEHQTVESLREEIQKYPYSKHFGIDIGAILSDDAQGSSVNSTLTHSLNYLRDRSLVSNNKSFSIKEYIRRNEHINQDSRLFVVMTPEDEKAYSTIYRVFFSLISKEIRLLPSRLDRRIWIIADEFQSLGRMPEFIEELPAEGRSKGACLILATQSLPKIEEVYGVNLTQSILGNMKTKIIFATGDTKGRKMLEDYFGKIEIEEHKESYSQGDTVSSNRINTSSNIVTRTAIMGAEIGALKESNAFIQMDEYVCRVEFSLIQLPDIISFQPIQRDFLNEIKQYQNATNEETDNAIRSINEFTYNSLC